MRRGRQAHRPSRLASSLGARSRWGATTSSIAEEGGVTRTYRAPTAGVGSDHHGKRGRVAQPSSPHVHVGRCSEGGLFGPSVRAMHGLVPSAGHRPDPRNPAGPTSCGNANPARPATTHTAVDGLRCHWRIMASSSSSRSTNREHSQGPAGIRANTSPCPVGHVRAVQREIFAGPDHHPQLQQRPVRKCGIQLGW
jgi:hypothetical protein